MAKGIKGYGSTTCAEGCTCKRHGIPGCTDGCACGKHSVRNSGQFKPGARQQRLGGVKKGWKGSDDERFDSKVTVAVDGCHIWSGALAANGYGSFYVNGTRVSAHAYSDNRVRGPLPEGLNRDHLCRVRRCVNPAHIERVTPAENNRRAAAFRRVA